MVTCLVVAGGVAANSKVRSTLQAVADKYNLPCLVPPVKFCSDNGLMVAWTGVERLKLGLCRCVWFVFPVVSIVMTSTSWGLRFRMSRIACPAWCMLTDYAF
jgi:tRNA A37 threonylcarbamoyltransferase TsaD